MIALRTPAKSQTLLAENARTRRLQMDLTQQGLAHRAGVPLATVRKFEQKGAISLQSFLKIQLVLGGLDDIVTATQIKTTPFQSIDAVLHDPPSRQRGKRL